MDCSGLARALAENEEVRKKIKREKEKSLAKSVVDDEVVSFLARFLLLEISSTHSSKFPHRWLFAFSAADFRLADRY